MSAEIAMNKMVNMEVRLIINSMCQEGKQNNNIL